MEMIKLSEVFDIEYGGNFTRVGDYAAGNTPVIKSQATNNGIIALLDIEPNHSNIISVARTGSVGASFYHEYKCYITDDCMVLSAKTELDRLAMLVYSKIIECNAFKYNYGRKVTPSRLSKESIPIPDEIIKISSNLSYPDEPPSSAFSKNPTEADLLAKLTGSFKLSDIFEIKKGQRLTKFNMTAGDTPFIGAIDSNNGYRQYVSVTPNHPGNTITVNYNGNGVADAFYQPAPYWASDDVNVLYPKFELTPFIAMFLCTLIRREKFRFNYGRKWHLGRMNEAIIKLPEAADGQPDWEFMEAYVKAQPFSVSL